MGEAKVADVRGAIANNKEALHPDGYSELDEGIPTLDFAPYLEGEAGGLEKTAAALREISTTVGFFYLKNHGVPGDVVERMFAASRRFHALPDAERRSLCR